MSWRPRASSAVAVTCSAILVSQIPHAGSSSGKVWAPLRVVDWASVLPGNALAGACAGAAQPAVVQAPIGFRQLYRLRGIDLSMVVKYVLLLDSVTYC